MLTSNALQHDNLGKPNLEDTFCKSLILAMVKEVTEFVKPYAALQFEILWDNHANPETSREKFLLTEDCTFKGI